MNVNHKNFIQKSKKTLERIEEIQKHIAGYQESVRLLHAFAEGRETLVGKGCTERAVQKFLNYQRTQEDDERMQWTLKNIKRQIALLERELMILLEYGA